MKRGSRTQGGLDEANDGRTSTATIVGLVGIATILIAVVVILAVTKGSDTASKTTAAPDPCGVVDRSSLAAASMAMAVDGGMGSCDDFGSTVTTSDAGTRFAMRITYVNEGEASQNVTLRLDLPSAVVPEIATAKIYDGSGHAADTLATGSLLWSDDGLKLGTYDPEQAAIVVAYATVDGNFDPAGCEELRDPVTAYAASRGETTVSAELVIQVGTGCGISTS